MLGKPRLRAPYHQACVIRLVLHTAVLKSIVQPGTNLTDRCLAIVVLQELPDLLSRRLSRTAGLQALSYVPAHDPSFRMKLRPATGSQFPSASTATPLGTGKSSIQSGCAKHTASASATAILATSTLKAVVPPPVAVETHTSPPFL